MALKDAKVGSVVTECVWIKSIQTLTAKNGQKYQAVVLRDTEGLEYKAFKFDPLIEEGSYVATCEIVADEYNGNPSYKLNKVVKEEKVGVECFMPKAHVEVKKTWGEITKMVKEIKRPTLLKLVCRVLNRERDQFLTYPLNSTGAFARTSGIIEATWQLMKLTKSASEIMQGLDTDLLLAGAAIYYIGKSTTITGQYEYTKDDALMGDGLSAYTQLLGAYYSLKEEDSDIEEEDMRVLGHILMSRFKGINTAVPEAAVLRFFDAAIVSSDEMMSSLNKIEEGNMVVDSFGKKLYKQKKRVKKENDKVEQPV